MAMMDDKEEHEYRQREVEPSPERELRIGEGRISGYLAITLGVLSFLGVLCYRFPAFLTTADLRAAYDADTCLLYTSPSPRDQRGSRMPSSA